MSRRILSISLTLSITIFLQAQDYSWWNLKHNWDGYSSWSDYLVVSPAYLGPNALPVPEVRKGFLQKQGTLELMISNYLSLYLYLFQ